MDWSAMVAVGRIVRPQGHRGEVVIEPETDFPASRYGAGATLWANRRGDLVQLTVETSRPHQGRWVVRFVGVTSIEDAETWRGAELRVPESALGALEPGSFWVHDLLGCEVVTVGGTSVGIVQRIDLATGVPMLAVDAGGEVLIPLVEAICRRIDVAARRITVDPPEGLIDLNRKKG